MSGEPTMIIIYDLETGQLARKWKPSHNTTSLVISSDSRRVVNGMENGNILVWCINTDVCQ